MKVSVYGLGYVGCVNLGCLADLGFDAIGIDIDQGKVKKINRGQATVYEKGVNKIIKNAFSEERIKATTDQISPVLETDISIIAVGTPAKKSGELELRNVFDVATSIGKALKTKKAFHTIAIRSTVTPGTYERVIAICEKISGKKHLKNFGVAINPEFLREGTAISDFFNPPYTIIGSKHRKTIESTKKLYKNINAEVIICSPKIAEVIKFVSNAFHALKVSFANEIGSISKKIGVDSNELMDLFCKDRGLNISSYYLNPGPAYGGSCLPKDLKALKMIAQKNKVDSFLLSSIEKSNNSQIKKAVQLIESIGKQRIGILGISFKAGTDDIRNSPAIEIISALHKKGYKVNYFDRNVKFSNFNGSNKQYFQRRLPNFMKFAARDIGSLIANSDVIVVTNKERLYLTKVKEIRDKQILDLAYLGERIAKKKNYIGINW